MIFQVAKQNGIIRSVHKSMEDLIDGYQFVATLNFSTPLQLLEMHGKKVSSEAECTDYRTSPEKDPYGMYGIWLYSISGFDDEHKQASAFGSVYAHEVLPILKAYRKIIESNKAPQEKYALLKQLYNKNRSWQMHIDYAIKQKFGSLEDFWAINNLISIKGIGMSKAKKLVADGIYTIEQYEARAV